MVIKKINANAFDIATRCRLYEYQYQLAYITVDKVCIKQVLGVEVMIYCVVNDWTFWGF